MSKYWWVCIFACTCTVLPLQVGAQPLEERFDRAREMIMTDTAGAESLAQELLSYSLLHGNDEYTARAYYLLGLIAYYNNRHYLSVDYYSRALQTTYAQKDAVLNEYIWNNLGVAYDNTGRLTDALEAYQHSLKHAEQRGDSLSVAQTWLNMGLLLEQVKEYDQAETLFNQAKNVMYQLGDTLGLVLSYQNLSKVNESNKAFDQALIMVERALLLATEAELDRKTVILLYNLAVAVANTGDPQASVRKLELAVSLAKEQDIPHLLRLSYQKLVSNYTELEQFNQAEYYLQQVHALVEQNAHLEHDEGFWQIKANFNAKNGNYERYLDAMMELRELQQLRFSQENQKLFQEMLVLYENEKMLGQMELLEAAVLQNRLSMRYLLIFLLVLTVATVVISFLYVRNKRQMRILYRKAITDAGRPFLYGTADTYSKVASTLLPQHTDVYIEDFLSETEKSGITSAPLDKYEKLYNALVKQMQVEKPYLDPNLTKGDLAKHLSTNERYVSQAIRMYADTNFTGFVNTYRVAEAIRLLQLKESGMSMDEIAEKAGFNSRSSFYRNFQELTGLSPSSFMVLNS